MPNKQKFPWNWVITALVPVYIASLSGPGFAVITGCLIWIGYGVFALKARMEYIIELLDSRAE